MSIATMKKKTQAQYSSHSVGPQGFSINGTHRNQGYVGQTMLSRSLPRTLMKGNTLRGHGGCCGKYNIGPVIQSAVTSTEDPNIVKSAVINTPGLIATKYRWIRRPQPYMTVKPDYNQNINSQTAHITNLTQKTINNINSCNNTDGTKPVSPNKTCCQYVGSSNYNVSTNNKNITKPISNYVPISQGEYILKLDNKCTNNNVAFVNNPKIGAPLPGNPASY
jgi:hypothetical protein